MDDVQPGKITGGRGHVRGGHFRMATGTGGISLGVYGGWAILRAWQAIQGGFGEMASLKHGQNCSICGGGLQVSLPTEGGGLVRPASLRSTTIKDVLIHILGNAVTGGPGTQAGIRGRRTSAMRPVSISEGCHV
jgi:hypothetical protein